MTVIAYRNGIMAADRMISIGGTGGLATTKIVQLSGGIFGMCGHTGDCWQAARLPCDETGLSGRIVPFSSENAMCGVLVLRDGRTFLVERAPDGTVVSLPVESDFIALGAGREMAIGAMAAGASAQQAVEIVNRFENGCGHGVDVVALNLAAEATDAD